MKSHRRILPLISPLVFITLLWGCSAEPIIQQDVTPPEWVSGVSTQYPSSDYIIGLGHYKYLSGAKNRAREHIANEFKITIKKDIIAALPNDQVYTTSTAELLNEIKMIDVWKNPNTKEQYVFAVLPHKKSIASLTDNISQLDYNTHLIIRNATAAKDKLEKIVFAYQALNKQIERLAYQQVLKKINPTGEPLQQTWQISRLSIDFLKLLKRIRIKPNVTNDESKKIEQALVDGLEYASLSIDFSNSADFTLQTTLILDDYNEKRGEDYITTGELKIKLIDKKRNIRGIHTWPINVLVKQPGMTNKMIAEQALQIFKSELQSTLIKFATKRS